MGRKRKETVDYFSHDVNHGKTMFILESKYGNNGYAFWFKLLEILCQTEGHAYDFSEAEDMEYMLAYVKIERDDALNMLSTLADLGAIDAKLHANKVIWSDGLMERLSYVYGKRATDMPVKPDSRDGKGDNRSGNPQSKVKESKGKEYMPPMGQFKNVLLTEDEHKRLSDKFGDSLPDRIEKLSEGIASKGYKYKSHCATIQSWARKEKEKTEANKPKENPRESIVV